MRRLAADGRLRHLARPRRVSFPGRAKDRAAYIDRLHAGVKPGGHAIIATFAPDGPEKCSGLPVQRYNSESLSRTIGAAFDLVEHLSHRHLTPWGAEQSFQFSVLRRR